MREREGEREREREREREADRNRERQRHTETETEREKERYRRYQSYQRSPLLSLEQVRLEFCMLRQFPGVLGFFHSASPFDPLLGEEFQLRKAPVACLLFL